MSLGWAAAGHRLEDKIHLAYSYGYKGLELFHDDLDELAARKFAHLTSPPHQPASDPVCRSSHAAQLLAADWVRSLCANFSITIICLQPFAGYEGRLDPVARAEGLAKLTRWLELARRLGTDMVQIPSSFVPAEQMTADLGVIAADLRRFADLGASVGIRFVFEALCWGTRVDLWETSWELVRMVDRPNFGLCLDSFNIAGRIYADPACSTCKCVDAEAAVEASMKKLVAEVDVSKVFYVQIVDAERLSSPLVAGHKFYDASRPTRMNWSRNCRLFYGEEARGGYLPIREIAETFFHKLGFEGWVSLELFNRRMNDRGVEVCQELASRGALSWYKLVQDLGLKVESEPLDPEDIAAVPAYQPMGTTEAVPSRAQSGKPAQQAENLVAMAQQQMVKATS